MKPAKPKSVWIEWDGKYPRIVWDRAGSGDRYDLAPSAKLARLERAVIKAAMGGIYEGMMPFRKLTIGALRWHVGLGKSLYRACARLELARREARRKRK